MRCSVVIDGAVMTGYRYRGVDRIYSDITVCDDKGNVCEIRICISELISRKSHISRTGVCLSCGICSAERKAIRYIV